MENEFEETTMIHVQEDGPQPEMKPKAPKKKKKKKLTKAGRILFQVILVIALGVACYSGYHIYSGLKQYNQGDEAYGELAKTMLVTDASDDATSYDSKLAELEKLREQNSDFVAWLRLDDSLINYPVVRGTDNEFYLRHLFTKEYNFVGCVFIDYRNAKDFSDTNTAFYSHHMYNGTMFCDLVKYNDQAFYETHKEWTLDTFNGPYKIEPFAGIYTTGDADILHFNFESDEAFMEYVRPFYEQSTFKSDIKIQPGDQMVMFVTCDNYVKDGRYVLFSKLTPIE